MLYIQEGEAGERGGIREGKKGGRWEEELLCPCPQMRGVPTIHVLIHVHSSSSITTVMIIGNSKFRRCYSYSKRRAPAHKRAYNVNKALYQWRS